jgi:hypothetical protein
VKVTTLSSREVNQDTSQAKKAAAEGPIFIPDALAMPGLTDIELDLPPRTEVAHPVDLS